MLTTESTFDVLIICKMEIRMNSVTILRYFTFIYDVLIFKQIMT